MARKLIRALLALTVIAAFANSAFSAELSGKLKEIDAEAKTYVFEDGTRISLPPGQVFLRFDPGTKITLEYEERDGQKILKSFKSFGEPAPQQTPPRRR